MRKQNTPLIAQESMKIDVAMCRSCFEVWCLRMSAILPLILVRIADLLIQDGVEVVLLLALPENDGRVG